MKMVCYDQTEVTIDIPKHLTHIGVMVSGGFDSAILLYLVLKEIQDTNRNIKLTVFNVPNVKDNADYFSNQVVNFLEKHFNKTISDIRSIGDGTLPHNQIIQKPGRYIGENKLVEKLYVGVNQNPPIKFPIAGPWRRDPNDIIPDNLSYPFLKLYKTHILDLYSQFGMLELANITHSCTETLNNRCNQCFQCYERAWAYKELNLVDTGI